MTFTLDGWQVATIVFTLIGMFAGIIKYAISHLLVLFNERRKSVSETTIAIQAKLVELEEKQEKFEREYLIFKGDLPLHYVRREDYVMNQTIIEAKLNALASKSQEIIELIYSRGGTNA